MPIDLSRKLPGSNIYVWDKEEHDYSRWLALAHRGPDSCVIYLSELCLPGKASRLTSVTCPTSYLKSAIERGALQITLATGYLLLWQSDEVVHLEFRGVRDPSTIQAKFKADDFKARIDAIAVESERVPVTGSAARS